MSFWGCTPVHTPLGSAEGRPDSCRAASRPARHRSPGSRSGSAQANADGLRGPHPSAACRRPGYSRPRGLPPGDPRPLIPDPPPDAHPSHPESVPPAPAFPDRTPRMPTRSLDPPAAGVGYHQLRPHVSERLFVRCGSQLLADLVVVLVDEGTEARRASEPRGQLLGDGVLGMAVEGTLRQPLDRAPWHRRARHGAKASRVRLRREIG